MCRQSHLDLHNNHLVRATTFRIAYLVTREHQRSQCLLLLRIAAMQAGRTTVMAGLSDREMRALLREIIRLVDLVHGHLNEILTTALVAQRGTIRDLWLTVAMLVMTDGVLLGESHRLLLAQGDRRPMILGVA